MEALILNSYGRSGPVGTPCGSGLLNEQVHLLGPFPMLYYTSVQPGQNGAEAVLNYSSRVSNVNSVYIWLQNLTETCQGARYYVSQKGFISLYPSFGTSSPVSTVH